MLPFEVVHYVAGSCQNLAVIEQHRKAIESTKPSNE